MALLLFHLVPLISSPCAGRLLLSSSQSPLFLEAPPNVFLPNIWPLSSLLNEAEGALAKTYLRSVNKYSTTWVSLVHSHPPIVKARFWSLPRFPNLNLNGKHLNRDNHPVSPEYPDIFRLFSGLLSSLSCLSSHRILLL